MYWRQCCGSPWLAKNLLCSQELGLQICRMPGYKMFSSWAQVNRHAEIGFYAFWHCRLVAERVFDPATCTSALTYFDSPSGLLHVLYTPCGIALSTLSPGSCSLLFCLIIIVFLGYGQGNSNRLRALSKNP